MTAIKPGSPPWSGLQPKLPAAALTAYQLGGAAGLRALAGVCIEPSAGYECPDCEGAGFEHNSKRVPGRTMRALCELCKGSGTVRVSNEGVKG